MTSLARRFGGSMALIGAALLTLDPVGSLRASPQGTKRGDAEKTILRAIEILRSAERDSHQRFLAYAMYRRAVADLLPVLKGEAVPPEGRDKRGFLNPRFFPRITAVQRPRATASGLYREGLGLPVIE